MHKDRKIRATVVPDRGKKTVKDIVKDNVNAGSELHTDEFSYGWYRGEEFTHQVTNHAEKYVDGYVHTNGLENFWSLLKRGISGTYVSYGLLANSRFITNPTRGPGRNIENVV